MKKWLFLNVILATTLILGACSTSNNVVSNKLISKRKYEKGFHINKKAHLKDDDEAIVDENLKSDENKKEASVIFSKKIETNSLSRHDMKTENVGNEKIAESSVEANGVESIELTSDNEISSFDVADSPSTSSRGIHHDDKKSKENLEVQSSNSKRAPSGTGELVLLIILALFLPPVAIIIYSGATTIFWIDLLLFLIAVGGFWFFRLAGIAGLAAVVIAFLVIFDVI